MLGERAAETACGVLLEQLAKKLPSADVTDAEALQRCNPVKNPPISSQPEARYSTPTADMFAACCAQRDPILQVKCRRDDPCCIDMHVRRILNGSMHVISRMQGDGKGVQGGARGGAGAVPRAAGDLHLPPGLQVHLCTISSRTYHHLLVPLQLTSLPISSSKPTPVKGRVQAPAVLRRAGCRSSTRSHTRRDCQCTSRQAVPASGCWNSAPPARSRCCGPAGCCWATLATAAPCWAGAAGAAFIA